MSEQRRQWHLDKNVSVGHVVTTVVFLVAGISWAINNEGRMRDIESAATYNEKRLTRVEQTQINQAEWIQNKLEQIRVEQREDILRLSEVLQKGFIRIENKLDDKKDK